MRITGGFWKSRQDITRDVSIPATFKQIKVTGRIDAFKLDWKPDAASSPPHIFWDSDTAKWVETVGYSLVTKPDKILEKQLDALVDSIVAAQQPDGYLNTHFTVVDRDKRFTNLRDLHELYCAGHLMEAAIAHFQSTGKMNFLNAMARYADYLDSVFGPAETGKKPGYCGHPEIELALVKLAKATGKKKYLDLATFFINQRGQMPFYFEQEAEKRGEKPKDYLGALRDREYRQSHIPIREMEEIVGHAVRAQYLMSGAVDVARETGDEDLMRACRAVWNNASMRKNYITGGMGARAEGEAFGEDYELPNESAYAETCAAIAFFFWGHRLLQIDGDAKYADAMERALYNGILSGVSLSGDQFLYVNPLAANLGAGKLERTTWFGCSCCPNNLTRLVLSLGQYIYSVSSDAVYIHFFVEGEAKISLATAGGQEITLRQKTIYPWEGKVDITLSMAKEAEFAVKVRIPGWCKSVAVGINGNEMDASTIPVEKGYMVLSGAWNDGDVIEIVLDMPVERVRAHPSIDADRGLVALQRGPVVYCLEEIDNGKNLGGIALPRSSKLLPTFEPGLLGGVVAISADASRLDMGGWEGILYANKEAKHRSTTIKAVPYFTWGNRGKSQEMIVWVREQ